MSRLALSVAVLVFAFPAMAQAQIRVMTSRSVSIMKRPAPMPQFMSSSTLVFSPNVLSTDVRAVRALNAAGFRTVERQNLGFSSAYSNPYGYSPYAHAYPYSGYSSSGYSSYPMTSYPMMMYSSPPSSGGYSANSSGYDKGASPPAPAAPETPKGNSAVIIIHVPLALADVAVNGVKMKETGKSREYIAKGLEPDKNYTFAVQANWTEGGVAQSVVRDVSVSAGQTATVDIGSQR
jgi:uncharacterized protein (TIGR03000 family)